MTQPPPRISTGPTIVKFRIFISSLYTIALAPKIIIQPTVPPRKFIYVYIMFACVCTTTYALFSKWDGEVAFRSV